MPRTVDEILAHADELHEPCDGGLSAIMNLCPARCLDLANLLLDQLEPNQFALNLCTQLLPKRFTMGRPPVAPVAPANAYVRTQVVQHQQRSDAIGM